MLLLCHQQPTIGRPEKRHTYKNELALKKHVNSQKTPQVPGKYCLVCLTMLRF